jgi:hypothetical protein
VGQSFEVFTDELEAITKLFLVDKFCLKIERDRGVRQDDAETTLCSEVEWKGSLCANHGSFEGNIEQLAGTDFLAGFQGNLCFKRDSAKMAMVHQTSLSAGARLRLEKHMVMVTEF